MKKFSCSNQYNEIIDFLFNVIAFILFLITYSAAF